MKEDESTHCQSPFDVHPAVDYNPGLWNFTTSFPFRPGFLFFACSIFLIACGCNSSFEPMGDNREFHFSMYGYLDASADTQWVRVTPARMQLELSDNIPTMQVTLENIQTGQKTVLKDSLFTAGDEIMYLNYWTTFPVEHNQTYLLIAQREDGKSSSVTVITPEELPTPRVRREESHGGPLTYSVMVDDFVNLADVQTRYFLRIHTGSSHFNKIVTFTYRNSAQKIEAYGGIYNIEIYPNSEMSEIKRAVLLPVDAEIEVVYRQIYVASSGTEWNEELASIEDIVHALPESFSNVDGGVGYVIGIDSKIVPYKSCKNNQEVHIPCPEEEPYW